MSRIKHIYIAPSKGADMQALQTVEATTNYGLVGDRYANDGKAENQITLIEIEAIEAFTRQTGLPLRPDEPRRNIVTTGVRLNALCEERFLLGNVELEGIELCEPCASFAAKTYPEALKFFVHKGGLRARIIKGGTIKLGDSITTTGSST